MSWAALIPIIAEYGIPFAQKLWEKWSANKMPSEADWAELRQLAEQSAQDRMRLALTKAGVPLDTPLAKQLLDLAQ